MKKSLGNPIRYKTFVPSYDGFIGSQEKAIGKKLVTIYESKASDDSRVHRFVGTSESKDRDGEVAKLESWDFTNYVHNPVVLWGHDHSSLPIGKTVGIYKDEVKRVVYFDIEFSESYDFAKTVKGLVEEGILSATSLGFRVLDWDYDTATDAVVFTKSELFEISVVNVPANQDALIQHSVDEQIIETKAVDLEQLANAITQIQTNLETLTSRVESLDTSRSTEPKEDDTITLVGDGTQIALAADDVMSIDTLDGQDISVSIAPELLERVTQEVLQRINQLNKDEDLPANDPEPSKESDDEAQLEDNPEPTPDEEEENIIVSVEDLDEAEGFVIVNEEEN